MSKEEAVRELLMIAKRIDDWAFESETGGWSTHQVKANREMADRVRRVAADMATRGY